MSKARMFLIKNMRKDVQSIGSYSDNDLEEIANAWMDDNNNSKHRFDIIEQYLPKSKKILDMASGTGTFVYYGLLNGYDTYGIEPEEWKFNFNRMKAKEYYYPPEWQKNFIKEYGENLGFMDNLFDVTSSYQTLEHVNNPKQCIAEMIRVTKHSGGIHIMCPDYRSTFEGHYKLAWLPLFPRWIASLYLKIRGRNSEYLKTLNYITSSKIYKYLKEISKEKRIKLDIIDVKRQQFEQKLKNKNILFLKKIYFIYQSLVYLKKLFRSEIQTNLFIIVDKS
jgi:ubiquinone/menaquinone biosynthesis C-methylase UbiE